MIDPAVFFFNVQYTGTDQTKLCVAAAAHIYKHAHITHPYSDIGRATLIMGQHVGNPGTRSDEPTVNIVTAT